LLSKSDCEELASEFFRNDNIHSHLYQEIATRYHLAITKAFADFKKSKDPHKKLHLPKSKFSFEDYKSLRFKQKDNGYNLDFKNKSVSFNLKSNLITFSFETNNGYDMDLISRSDIKFIQLKYNSSDAITLYIVISGNYNLKPNQNILNIKTLNNHPLQKIYDKAKQKFWGERYPRLSDNEKGYIKEIRKRKQRQGELISASQKPKTSTIGFDIGLGYNNFLVGSDASIFNLSPKVFVLQTRLEFQKSLLTSKNIGSKSYLKLSLAITKTEKHLVNLRDDCLHKLSKYIVMNYKEIYLEDFKSQDYTEKNGIRFLNKQVYNNAIGKLKFYIGYKSEMSAAHFQLIDPEYTSQICSNPDCECDYKDFKKKELGDRKHVCKSCGLACDRDLNAALNILQLGCNPLFREKFQRIVIKLKEQSEGSRNRPIKNKKFLTLSGSPRP
jgi:IS605 OrfB family transposase